MNGRGQQPALSRPAGCLQRRAGRRYMIRRLALFCCLLLGLPVYADEGNHHGDMAGFYAGTYVLVGKKMDSDETFVGSMVLEHNGDGLTGYRLIADRRVSVSGKIEHPRCCEQVHMLRLEFKDGDRDLLASYLLDTDLDNYGRLSGFVYDPERTSDWPGMEVLFFDKRSIRFDEN